jgi:hypothetical protein
MKLAAQAMGSGEMFGRDLPPVERVRLANGAVRQFEAYQNGILALQRFRCGSTQTVTVQHVQVGPGGQALVAGSVKAAKRAARERRR